MQENLEMEKFTLLRDYKAEATTGIIFDKNGKKICATLERPNLNNQRDNPRTKENESSCIPEGIYVCKKYSSAKFPDVWEIKEVPNRSAILFHSANYISQLLGCVALCNQVIDMNPQNKSNLDSTERWYASQSRDAVDKFRKIMPKEFLIQITSLNTLCNVS